MLSRVIKKIRFSIGKNIDKEMWEQYDTRVKGSHFHDQIEYKKRVLPKQQEVLYRDSYVKCQDLGFLFYINFEHE